MFKKLKIKIVRLPTPGVRTLTDKFKFHSLRTDLQHMNEDCGSLNETSHGTDIFDKCHAESWQTSFNKKDVHQRLKILSYNCEGFSRAVISNLMEVSGADILLLQESKMTTPEIKECKYTMKKFTLFGTSGDICCPERELPRYREQTGLVSLFKDKSFKGMV